MKIPCKVELLTPGSEVRWLSHTEQWQRCQRCPLGKRARKHVLGRGMIPAQVLVLGESPGDTENITGWPFCGKSGKLLQHAIDSLQTEKTWFISNVLACRPCMSAQSPFRPPKVEELDMCAERVIELVDRIVKPSTVLLLGNQASRAWTAYIEKHLTRKVSVVRAYHPSYVCRNGGVNSEKYAVFMSQIEEAF